MVQNPRKRYEYEKSRFLRSRYGLSYNEIKKKLGIAKSSISLWCRDIQLSKKQRQRLLRNWLDHAKLGAQANYEKRQREIAAVREAAKNEIVQISRKGFMLAGTMLYWAEGTKTSSAAISNSDPKIIEFMVRWFSKVLNIPPRRLKAHLHIHYGDDEKKIKKYWSRLTGIPPHNFGKSFIKPRGTGHRTNILPNGIIKIRVLGIGTENLRHRILAWTEKIYDLSKLK